MLVLASLGAVIVIALGLGIALSENDTAQGSPSAPTVSSPPSPVPTIADQTPPPHEPDPSTRPLPTDCRAIYTQAFLNRYAQVELNLPEVMDTGTSRFPEVETLRQNLPGMKCYWGGATEGGVQNAVNSLPADQRPSALDAVRAAGATCEEWNGGTLCTKSDVVDSGEDTTQWTIAEQFYFRDGLWVTTWYANSIGESVDEVTMPIYETLWP